MTPTELKSLRARLGLTQSQLADRLGVDRNTINRWEMGQRKISKPVSRLLATLNK